MPLVSFGYAVLSDKGDIVGLEFDQEDEYDGGASGGIADSI